MTYVRIVFDVQPKNIDELIQVLITVGGNLIDYPGKVRTETANLMTSKIHRNIVISTPGAKYMCNNVTKSYLNTTMERYEYMRMHISLLPDKIIEAYKLMEKVGGKRFTHMEIWRRMYGFPHAGIFANYLLEK